MDIAVTRFSDRKVKQAPSVNSATREAYSREVISSGFWFGDPTTFPEPAFYSYTAPEPDDVVGEPLSPSQAEWLERGASHLAVYRYSDARRSADLKSSVLAFLESTYQAGAALAEWDIARLYAPKGITASR